jgi:hypothetical protein
MIFTSLYHFLKFLGIKKKFTGTFYTEASLASVTDRGARSHLSSHVGQEGPGHNELVGQDKAAGMHGSPAGGARRRPEKDGEQG